jgi:ankyrin repeat protein
MLYEVDDWIRSGHIIPTEGDKTCSPLTLAAGKGFHSLVKLLLRQTWPQSCLDAALGRAAAGGYIETIKLLLDHGANTDEVVAMELVRCGTPDAVYLLVAKGVDIETGFPLARALASETPKAMELLRHGSKRLETIRTQAAIALKHAVREGEEHRVTRLIHAGASPRLKVSCLYDYEERRFPYKTTAMWEAFMSGSFRMFIRMGAKKSDDLQEYLNDSYFCSYEWSIMKQLIHRGAKINDQPSGGSTIIDKCLWHRGEFARYGISQERSEKAFEAIGKLAELGGRWVPDDHTIKDRRSALLKLDARDWLNLAKLLVERHVATPDTVWKLCNTKGVQERLGEENWKLVAELCGRKVKLRKKAERWR